MIIEQADQLETLRSKSVFRIVFFFIHGKQGFEDWGMREGIQNPEKVGPVPNSNFSVKSRGILHESLRVDRAFGWQHFSSGAVPRSVTQGVGQGRLDTHVHWEASPQHSQP